MLYDLTEDDCIQNGYRIHIKIYRIIKIFNRGLVRNVRREARVH